MGSKRELATNPEDVTRLFVDRANAGDAEGMAELYATDGVLAYPPGQSTVGRDAIRAVFDRMVAQRPQMKPEDPMPSVRYGDLALTSTRSTDNTGVRVQVVRRGADGGWQRIIDRPEQRT